MNEAASLEPHRVHGALSRRIGIYVLSPTEPFEVDRENRSTAGPGPAWVRASA